MPPVEDKGEICLFICTMIHKYGTTGAEKPLPRGWYQIIMIIALCDNTNVKIRDSVRVKTIHVTTLLQFFSRAVIHLPRRVMTHHHLRPYVSFQKALIEVMANAKL